jgi:hypothetical protein
MREESQAQMTLWSAQLQASCEGLILVEGENKRLWERNAALEARLAESGPVGAREDNPASP